MKIAVLLGGRSAEREVSLRTGKAVFDALQQKGFHAVTIDVDENIVENLKKEKADLVFLALHGKYGEDGTIQGLLELMGIPYTGPGVLASAIAIDKIMTKKILVFSGIPTPEYMFINKHVFAANPEKTFEQIKKELSLPVVVKAPTQGSSIGVAFVHREEEIIPGLKLAMEYDEEILIEKMIPGVEVTASVLGNRDPVVLPLIEIVTTTGVYDYETKYTVGMSDHIIPPRLPAEVQQEIQRIALKTYQAIGCRGLSRVDFIVDKDFKPYVLEVNTIPGMTATSLFPDAARAAGLEFPDLVAKIIELAMEK
jgi:D-alanine-D-alanine ligase